jgi:RHS repeat-associated protein
MTVSVAITALSLLSFCLAGESFEGLTGHTGEEPDWRIVFNHVDHLGTPRLLTDESASVISRHAFFPFGEEVPGPWPIAASTNSHWYTGTERDMAGVSDYFLARNYSLSLVRFTRPDPSHVGTLLTDSRTWHGYSYVESSPLDAFDPDGLASVRCRLLATASSENYSRAFAKMPRGFHIKKSALTAGSVSAFTMITRSEKTMIRRPQRRETHTRLSSII